MADLEFRFHPLGCEGPDGEDDEANAWLDGNRPISVSYTHLTLPTTPYV